MRATPASALMTPAVWLGVRRSCRTIHARITVTTGNNDTRTAATLTRPIVLARRVQHVGRAVEDADGGQAAQTDGG